MSASEDGDYGVDNDAVIDYNDYTNLCLMSIGRNLNAN